MNIHSPSPGGNPVKRHIVNDDSKSLQHRAALDRIAEGYRVIPIRPGEKTPMLNDWHTNAFETMQAVDEFWSENPQANIAICPEDTGMCVIEADTYKEDCEIDTLKLPPTYEVQSPRGGTHFYFKGSLRASASKLAKNVDTRGVGSYVLVPPSIVNGKSYKVKANRPVAQLPARIAEQMSTRSSASAAPKDFKPDAPQSVMTARSWVNDRVKRGVVAVEGQGGDTQTYEVACKLVRDFGLSVETAHALLMELFNPHCQPPWDPDELRTKLENAASYGQNEPGASTSPTAKEAFKNAPLDKVGEQPVKLANPFIPLDMLKVAASAPPDYWDPQGLFVRAAEGCNTTLYGPKGINKTGFTLGACISVVFDNPEACVLYMAGEAPEDVIRSRIPPILQHLGHTLEELVETGRFHVIGRVPQLLQTDDLNNMQAVADQLRPNIIVIDTASRAIAGHNVNQFETMSMVFKQVDEMRRHHKANVVLIHHTGKDVDRGAKGDSSLEQNSDVVLELSSPQDKVTKVRLKHNRFGADNVEALFRWNYYPHPYGPYSGDRRKDVPVLVPVTAAEMTSPIAPEKNDKWMRLRKDICKVLRAEHRHSPYGGVRTQDLAQKIVNLTWVHEQHPTAEHRDDFNTAVSKLQELLDNGCRMRKNGPGPLADLCEMRVPPGVSFGTGRLQRFWYIPEPRDDELPDEDEQAQVHHEQLGPNSSITG